MPACLTPENTCLAVIGDYGNAGTNEQSVADLVKSWDPDFIITVGDNNYDNGAASTIDANIGQYYHEFINPYTGSYGAGASTNRFFPALGNHDWRATAALPYRNYFTLPDNERYYDFTQGPVEIFAIDSDDHEPDGNNSTSTQANWLKNELAASTATWKIVYFHHPPFSSGSTHGSTAELQWPFQAWGATAVLSGHNHVYERVMRNGFPYFVNGLGGDDITGFGTPVTGSQVRYNGDYGAMLIDASDAQITFQFITRAGAVKDTYSITLHSGPPTVTISATDPTAAEPGTNTGQLTVSRTGLINQPLTVNYTVAGTASPGSDYIALSSSVTIPAGSASTNIIVTPKDDTMDEALETVTVTVSTSNSYARSSSTSATVNISDNDPATTLPVVTISATDPSASEGSGNTGQLTVSRSGNTTKALYVHYTLGGTAIEGSDYKSLTNTAYIEAGSASATIIVTPKDDTVSEASETVLVTLASSSTYLRGTSSSASIVIADNDVPANSVLVPTRSVWRYLDDGSDQGTAWRGVGFSDSTWATGAAPLGYGDGDESTVVRFGPDGGNKYITTYFRRAFTVADASLFNTLTLRLMRDDGAVVYLNGTPVHTSNVPTGTISFTTHALSSVSGTDENTLYESLLDAGLLRDGTNVIAVEIHQFDGTSSDLSFDLELIAST